MKKFYFLIASAIICGTNSISAQCVPGFFDGFESGSYSPTWTMGAGLTSAAVTTTNPIAGTYRLETTGGTSTHLTGLTTSIPSATPASISWYIYPTGTLSNNYFVAGDNAVSATNCVMFCYWIGASSAIRFVSGSSYQYSATPGQWYHIEMRNINWTAHTFDIYIDNVLGQANFPFRSATQNSITNLHLYNFNGGTGVYDDIQIGGSPLITLTNSFTNVACNGGSTGSIDLTVAGGTPGFSYAWSNSAVTEDISGLPAGTYSVTVTDAATCTQTASFTLTEPTAMVSTPMQVDVSCNGMNDGSAMVMESGGVGPYTYSWAPSGGTAALSTPLAPGTYTGTVIDANGCVLTQTFNIIEPAVLAATTTQTNISCNGGNNGDATVMPSGGTAPYYYFWSPNVGNTATVSALTAGTYTCMVMDSHSCSTTQTFTIAEPLVLASSASATSILCNADTSVVTVSSSGGTSPYSGDGTFPQVAGTYTYTVTDANGCTSTTSVTITEPTAITANATQINVSCFGGNDGSIDLTVSGGTLPYSFDWNSGAYTVEDPSGLTAGIYSGVLTDSNGCTTGGSMTITEPPLLVATVTTAIDPTTCTGTDGAIDVTITGGTAGYTFLWSTTDTTEDVSNLVAGTYSTTVTDTNGCTTTASATLTDPNPPTVTLSLGTSVVCLADGAFTLSGGSPAGGTYSGTAVSAGSFNPSAASLGANTVTYSYTDPTTGCSAIATGIVTVNACTGIVDATNGNNFVLMPNPNNGTFMLQINTTEISDVLIYDGLGQLVSSQKVQPAVQQELTIADSGVYLITVITADGHRTTQRVIVSK